MKDQLRRQLPPFAIIPVWVIDADISAGAVRTYAALADMANFDNKPAWPTHRYLAGRLACSVASVKRYIAELVQVGALRVEQRSNEYGQQSNLYWVIHIPPTVGEKVEKQNEKHLPQFSNEPAPNAPENHITKPIEQQPINTKLSKVAHNELSAAREALKKGKKR
jgi:predicted transcriptional regulator